MTRSTVDIMARSPIEKEKTPIQPVTTTYFPSARVPVSLSPIYVPRKSPAVANDYITHIVDIDGRYFDNSMCS